MASKIRFEFYNDLFERYEVETMHAIKVDDAGLEYEIDNIPFFVQSYACGDVVRVEIREDGMPAAIDLVRESGNSTINIIFFDDDVEKQDRILNELTDMGVSYEGLRDLYPYYFSLNIPKDIRYEPIQRYLKSMYDELDFREACLAQPHSPTNKKVRLFDFQLLTVIYTLLGQMNIEKLSNELVCYDTLPTAVKDRLLCIRPPAYDIDRNLVLHYRSTGRFPFWKGRTKVKFKNKIYYYMWNANKYSKPWVFHSNKIYLIESNVSALTTETRNKEVARKLTVRVFYL